MSARRASASKKFNELHQLSAAQSHDLLRVSFKDHDQKRIRDSSPSEDRRAPEAAAGGLEPALLDGGAAKV